jgi:hypothetical protein
MSKSVEPITGCKCLNPIAKDSIIKGITYLSNSVKEEIKRIQEAPSIDITKYQKMKGLLNYINNLERVKQSTLSTQKCEEIKIIKKKSIGDCSCLNPITRKFIIGSLDEAKNKESKEALKDQITLIKRDVIYIPECK